MFSIKKWDGNARFFIVVMLVSLLVMATPALARGVSEKDGFEESRSITVQDVQLESNERLNSFSSRQNVNAKQTNRVLVRTSSSNDLKDQDLVTSSNDLIISGTNVMTLQDAVYDNIYVFDQARVTLLNVTVNQYLEISDNASVSVLQGSSAMTITANHNSTVFIQDAWAYNIYGYDDSSITLLNTNASIFGGWTNIYAYHRVMLTVKNVVLGGATIYGYDSTQLTFSDLMFTDQWFWGYLELSTSQVAVATNLTGYFSVSVGGWRGSVSSVVSLQDVNSTGGLSVYGDLPVEVVNGQFASVVVYGSGNVTLESVEITGDVTLWSSSTVTMQNGVVKGVIFVRAYQWESGSQLTLWNTSVTIKKPSGLNSDETARLNILELHQSDAWLLMLVVSDLVAQDYANVTLLGTKVVNSLIDATSSITVGGTLLIDGDYYVSGTDVLTLQDSVYDNIYVFDRARVTLLNVTVNQYLEISDNASVSVLQGSSVMAIIASLNSTVFIQDAWAYNIYGYDDSSITLVNTNASIFGGWTSIYAYHRVTLTVKNVVLGGATIYGYDSTQLIISDLVFTDQWFWGYLELSTSQVAVVTNLTGYFGVSVGGWKGSASSVASLQNVNSTGGLNVYGDLPVEVVNGQFASVTVYDRGNVTLESVEITGDVTLWSSSTMMMQDVVVKGVIHVRAYQWESGPQLTLWNASVTIKKPSGLNSDEEARLDVLEIHQSNTSLLMLNVNVLVVKDHGNAILVGTEVTTSQVDATSSITVGGTLLIDGDYYVSGTDVLTLQDSVYDNIYVFDQARVTLLNVTINQYLEVSDEASVSVLQRSSVMTITASLNSTVFIQDAWAYNIYGYDDSSITLVNTNASIFGGWTSIYAYHRVTLTVKNVVLGGATIYGYDSTQLTFSDLVFTDQWFWGYLELSTSQVAVVTNLTGYFGVSVGGWSGSVSSVASLQDVNSTGSLSVYGDLPVEVVNGQFASVVVYGSGNVTLESVEITGDVTLWSSNTVTMRDGMINGTILVRAYQWESGPQLTLWNTNVVIKKPNGLSSDEEARLDLLEVHGTVVELISVQVNTFILSDYSIARLQEATISVLHVDSTSTIITDDQDLDGLSDEEEAAWGTDPLHPDSDGDGYLDGEEVIHGGDPLNATIYPVDLTGPMVNISSGNVLVPGFALEVGASDERGILYIEIWFNGTLFANRSYHAIIQGVAVPLHDSIVDSFGYGNQLVPDGRYQVTAFVVDLHGNVGSASMMVFVENSPVTITSVSPQNGSVVTDWSALNLTFSEPPVLVYYSWDGSVNSTSLFDNLPMTEGWHVLDVWILDDSGAWLHHQFWWYLEINEAPVVIIMSPAANDVVSGFLLIEWNATDSDNDFLTFDVYVGTDDGSTWILLSANQTWTYFYWDTTMVSDGTYWLKVVASDGMTSSEAMVGPIIVANTNDSTTTSSTMPTTTSASSTGTVDATTTSGTDETGNSTSETSTLPPPPRTVVVSTPGWTLISFVIALAGFLLVSFRRKIKSP